jgi:hypothetical protein
VALERVTFTSRTTRPVSKERGAFWVGQSSKLGTLW